MSEPIRVLHIFNRMDRGGAETWIVNVMRHIDRQRFQFDFLVESDQPGAYDEYIRAMGGELYHAGSPKRLLRFSRAFRRIVREYGPYDVVHSHVHHASGLMLALAASCGVRVRIAHSHTDSRLRQRDASQLRRIYFRAAELSIARFATIGIGVSCDAATVLFGERWENDPRWRLLHCGIDLDPFTKPIDRASVRSRLGITEDAFVIGHVGRFAPEKNHALLVDVFARFHRQRPESRLLLVGDGQLRPKIERTVATLGLSDAVLFTGVREDIPDLMLGAMDCFVLPSEYEGVPLVLLEAQAAGLPCAISMNVSDEAMVSSKVDRLSIGDESQWVKWLSNVPRPQSEARGRAADKGRESIVVAGLSLEESIEGLISFYTAASRP